MRAIKSKRNYHRTDTEHNLCIVLEMVLWKRHNQTIQQDAKSLSVGRNDHQQ